MIQRSAAIEGPTRRAAFNELIVIDEQASRRERGEQTAARDAKGDSKMPIVENRTKQLLIIQKNSGPSIYLAPGEAAELPPSEIDGNAKVEKLAKSGAVSVTEPSAKEASEERKGPKKPKSEK
jgi:hypothetical protein